MNIKLINTIESQFIWDKKTPCLFYYEDMLMAYQNAGNYSIPRYDQFEINTLGIKSLFSIQAHDGTGLIMGDLKDKKIPDQFIFENIKPIFHKFNSTDRNWISQTVGSLHWYRKHQFCSICAAPTIFDVNEYALFCSSCHYHFYPKVNPSMIVLVYKGSEILLARSPHFPKDMMSVLAGYVSPGESVEETIKREVKEEVNLEVKNIRYFASQAWPFPNTLMLGYFAEYAGGEIQIDNKEIEAAGWYSFDNLPQIPSGVSISRQLIDHFFNNKDLL